MTSMRAGFVHDNTTLPSGQGQEEVQQAADETK